MIEIEVAKIRPFPPQEVGPNLAAAGPHVLDAEYLPPVPAPFEKKGRGKEPRSSGRSTSPARNIPRESRPQFEEPAPTNGCGSEWGRDLRATRSLHPAIEKLFD
jgi:hypothetical protein